MYGGRAWRFSGPFSWGSLKLEWCEWVFSPLWFCGWCVVSAESQCWCCWCSCFSFYTSTFEHQFKQCMEFPAQHRYSIAFPMICSHFMNATHDLCPEEVLPTLSLSLSLSVFDSVSVCLSVSVFLLLSVCVPKVVFSLTLSTANRCWPSTIMMCWGRSAGYQPWRRWQIGERPSDMEVSCEISRCLPGE